MNNSTGIQSQQSFVPCAIPRFYFHKNKRNDQECLICYKRIMFLSLAPPPSPSCRNLADMEGDGKMDRLEFSIAMKLIKLKLQGRSMPSVLPIVMKQPPFSNSVPTVPSSARFGKNVHYITTVQKYYFVTLSL